MSFTEKFKDLSDYDLDTFFILACTNNELDAAKYLLTSPQLDYHPSLTEDNQPLRLACSSNFVEMVKYFLTSPDLKEHSDIYLNKQEAFKDACKAESLDVIQYLVLEFNIEQTPSIKEYLDVNNTKFNDTVKNMFILREVNKELNNELSSATNNQKKPKL